MSDKPFRPAERSNDLDKPIAKLKEEYALVSRASTAKVEALLIEACFSFCSQVAKTLRDAFQLSDEALSV
jgi:hypothetical protein